MFGHPTTEPAAGGVPAGPLVFPFGHPTTEPAAGASRLDPRLPVRSPHDRAAVEPDPGTRAVDGRPMTRVLRTRAELRAALADAPRPVGLVPTMGWLHDGHRALMRRARAADATTVATIFVNPRQFNVAADFTKYPRDEARDLADLRGGRDRPRLGPAGRGGLRPRLRHDRQGRRDRRAARGRRPAGSLRWRRDGRRDPVRRRRRRARLLRPEGRPAGHGHPPDGARSRAPDRGHHLPDGPRARRPRPLVTERPPHPGAASRRAGPASRAAGREVGVRGRRTIGRGPADAHARDRSTPSRSPGSSTCRSPTAPPWPSSTG